MFSHHNVNEKYTSLTLLIFMSILTVNDIEAAKILSINFISSRSHFIVYSPLLYGLAERGHNVTIFTPDPPDQRKHNVRHVHIYDTNSEVNKARQGMPNLFTARENTGSVFWKYLTCNFWGFLSFVEGHCRRGFEHPFTKELEKQKYDLIILTPLYNECLYGLLHKLNTTVVLFNQVSILPWQAESFGAPTLPSFNPLLYYGFSDRMNFWERVINFVGILYFEAVLEFYYNPAMERLYRQYVDSNIPPLKEIERNSSLILTNSHVSLVPPKPTMTDIIEIGGLHLRSSKSLPKELQEFCDGAGPDGFIIFSMGSFLQGSEMPGKYRQIFMKTFAKLKQRVIWKWETEQMDDVTSNVLLVKWLPQQDLLGHSNIRLFITHGGHGGTTEGLYAGVPLLGIPMFSDQFWNIEQAVRKGFAISLPYTDLTEDRLFEAISIILSDSNYRKNAIFLSKVYKDQLNNPLEKAIYWIEYVLRYGGATHLRSAGRDLNIFQYYSLDVIGFLCILIFVIALLNVFILKTILSKLSSRNSTELNVGKSKMKKR